MRVVALSQGESNSGADSRQYRCAMKAMIADWRVKWRNRTQGGTDPAFSFGWVQLNANAGADALGENPENAPGPNDPLCAAHLLNTHSIVSFSSEHHASCPVAVLLCSIYCALQCGKLVKLGLSGTHSHHPQQQWWWQWDCTS